MTDNQRDDNQRELLIDLLSAYRQVFVNVMVLLQDGYLNSLSRDAHDQLVDVCREALIAEKKTGDRDARS